MRVFGETRSGFLMEELRRFLVMHSMLDQFWNLPCQIKFISYILEIFLKGKIKTYPKLNKYKVIIKLP